MASCLRHLATLIATSAGRCAATCALLTGLALPGGAAAQIGSARYASIVVDHASRRVLEAANADALRYPASLTKLMTLYVAFEALRDHKIELGQTVPVSAHAASMEPSKLGLVPGTYLTVSDAILAIVTKSANDAAAALGELIGGDEDRFAQLMTLRARALGMTNSTFRNASGLPDPQQTTTARDLALLAHHLVQDFPGYYHYFSEPMFYFHGRAIPNHDHMLQDYEGADGLKTGYTIAAGHNLVTSAMRGGVRLIGVVMGARSNAERDTHMASLLDDGFEQMGVPITRRTTHFHLPSLIANATAAPASQAGLRYVTYRVHDKHGRIVKVRVYHGVITHHAAVHEAVHRVGATTAPHTVQTAAHLRGSLGLHGGSTHRAYAASHVAACPARASHHACPAAPHHLT
jgi:D-alanyl-D-alanine carboxypeptidase